jgi:hypothetical protein
MTNKTHIITMILLLAPFGCKDRQKLRVKRKKAPLIRQLKPAEVIEALIAIENKKKEIENEGDVHFTRKARKFAKTIKDSVDYQILGETIKGQRAYVQVLITIIEDKSEKKHKIQYNLRKEEGCWRVYEIGLPDKLMFNLEDPQKTYKRINEMIYSKEELAEIEKVMKLIGKTSKSGN